MLHACRRPVLRFAKRDDLMARRRFRVQPHVIFLGVHSTSSSSIYYNTCTNNNNTNSIINTVSIISTSIARITSITGTTSTL